MASSSSRMPAPNYKFDVFISFHGPDVRKIFASHLIKELERKKITMFAEQLIERSAEIASSSINPIRESRTAAVILSQKYASSSVDLDELVEIMKCKETRGQILPIYYGVDPSDVWNQMGEFWKTFNETCASKTEEERQKWINALKQLTDIETRHISSHWENELDMIPEIINDVLKKLNRTWPTEVHNTVTLPLLGSKIDEVEMAVISRPSGIDPSGVRYDVFCSFHRPDVRETFLSHIHTQFKNKAITMFYDQGIERGAEIAPSLIDAIRESRISIVNLSKKYASSSWQLDELVEILECRKTMGQIVMPIFYGVSPTDVQNQTGEFGKAFNKTCASKTDEERQRWSKALNEVGNIPGEDSLYWVTDADMIEKIANDIHELNATHSIDSDHSETKPLQGSDNDGINMGEISGHSGIDPSDVRTGNLGVLLDETCSSTTEQGFLSCSTGVEEICVVDIPLPVDDNTNQHPTLELRASRTKVTIELTLVIIFCILEIPSSVLDQISSTDRPSYVLVAMLLSLFACLAGLIDILYKAITDKVVWKSIWAPIPGFYYPTEISNPTEKAIMFGSFAEVIGLICGVWQSIFSAINYSFIIRKVDAPIKVCPWPIIFAIGALFSMCVRQKN